MRLRHLLKTTALTAFLLFAGKVGWTQYTGTGTFNKITSITDLTAGYYVIANSTDAFAMNNTMTTFFGNTAITPVGGAITNPATTIVWKIEVSGSGWSIFNEASAKYVSYTGSSNAAQAVDAVTTDNQRWTITFPTTLFVATNIALPTRILQYNASAPRFACYTGSQTNLNLYKFIPDVTPPTWTADYPKKANIAQTTLELLYNTNEAGKAYYVVVADGATAPTAAEVKAGTASGGGAAIAAGNKTIAAATTDYTSSITSLSASTLYDIYVVAEDNIPNLQAAPVLVDVTMLDPDITAPTWTLTYPMVTGVANTDFNLKVNINEIGKAYYVVLADGSAVPSSAQVKAGTDGTDVVALKANSITIGTATTEFTANISGLTSGTVYDVYVVAEDIVPNVQTSVAAIADVTTTSTKPEPTNQATGFGAVMIGQTAITLNWTDADGAQLPDGYLILMNETGTFTDPVDGTAQADGATVFNITQGVGTKALTGLVAGTHYYFKIYSYTNSGTAIDYLLAGAPAVDAALPKLALTYPNGGETFYAGQSVNLTWNTANITDVNIEVSNDNGLNWGPWVGPLTSDGAETLTIPTDAIYSTQYLLRISDASNAALNDVTDNKFIVTLTVNDLATLRSKSADITSLFTYTGTATITYARTVRNQKYIQDATGAFLIDDNTNIIGAYVAGEGIKNVVGKLSTFNGLVQFVPVTVVGGNGVKVTTGQPVITPEVRTIGSIALSADQCKLVKIVNYNFATTGQYATSNLFVYNKSYDIVGFANTVFAFRTAFTESNYLTTTVPITPITTVGLVGQFNTTMQITARNLADIQSAVATLSDLKVGGTTVAGFSSSTLTYSVNVPYGEAAPAVVETITDATSTTVVTQAADANGEATVVVTAQDGITTKTYTVDFTETPVNTDKTLSDLKVGLSTVSGFAPATLAYSVVLPTGTTDVPNVSATKNSSFATLSPVTQAVNLTGTPAERTASVLVTAQDATSQTYTIEFSVAAAGADASLSDLKVDGTTVVGFATSTLSYNVSLAANTTIVPAVTATTSDLAATKVINPATNLTGTLAERTTTVVVTSQSTLVTETYSVIFYVKSGDATLSDLTYNGTQVPSFAAGTLDYNVELPYGTTDIPVVVGTNNSANATVLVTPVTNLAGDLAARTATILVTAEDAAITKTYTIVFTVALNNDATLSALTYNGSPVSGFAAETLTYAVNLPTGTTAIPVVAATETDLNATVGIVQVTNLTGTVVERTATVTVTAANGSTTKIYTIVFTVLSASSSDLFFSEYVEGSGFNKAFEIYNPGSTAVDLNGYTVKVSNNGVGFGKWAGMTTPVVIAAMADVRYLLTFPAGTMIAPGDVYVVYDDGAVAPIPSVGDIKLTFYASAATDIPTILAENATHPAANVASYNGNDALALYKGTTLIDVFGGELITTDFNVAGVSGAAKDHSLIRKPAIHAGNPDWATAAGTDAASSEWIVGAVDIFTNLGSHTMDPITSGPSITISATTLADFGSVLMNNVSSEKSFTVSGSNLTADVVITAPAGFEISKNSGITFSSDSPITLTRTLGIVSETTIYARFAPTAVQPYTGMNITVTSTGATSKNVAVSGTGTGPSVTVSVATLTSFGNVTVNTTSAIQRDFTVIGSNLTANMVITAPTGFLISKLSGGSFTNESSISLTPSQAQTLTTIYVAFRPTSVQNYTGNITVATTGVTTKNVAVSGAGLSTGISDNWASDLKVYPNPFTSEIKFEGLKNVERVIVTSITGQVLRNAVIGENNSVDTQDLPLGIYIVTFMNDKGEKAIVKMIKQ